MAGSANVIQGFPSFCGQSQDELEFWVMSVDEFVQTKYGNNQNGSSQVMGAVRASLLQEDRYKTWMSNLIERQDHRLKKWSEFRPAFMARWLPPLSLVEQIEAFEELKQRSNEDVMTYGDRFERAFNKIVGSTRPQTVVGTTGSNEYQDGFDLAVDHMAKFKFIQGLSENVRTKFLKKAQDQQFENADFQTVVDLARNFEQALARRAARDRRHV